VVVDDVGTDEELGRDLLVGGSLNREVGDVALLGSQVVDGLWYPPPAFQDGTVVDVTGWEAAKASNFIARVTVHAIVVEVPDLALATVADDGRIGVWAIASLQADAGGVGAPSTASASR